MLRDPRASVPPTPTPRCWRPGSATSSWPCAWSPDAPPVSRTVRSCSVCSASPVLQGCRQSTHAPPGIEANLTRGHRPRRDCPEPGGAHSFARVFVERRRAVGSIKRERSRPFLIGVCARGSVVATQRDAESVEQRVDLGPVRVAEVGAAQESYAVDVGGRVASPRDPRGLVGSASGSAWACGGAGTGRGAAVGPHALSRPCIPRLRAGPS